MDSSLKSKAAGGLEGPCIALSKINIFLIKEDDFRHSYCMDEFKKLGGRSPPVTSETRWKNLWKETKALSPDPSRLPTYIRLFATKGDVGDQLGQLEQWSMTTVQKVWLLWKVC